MYGLKSSTERGTRIVITFSEARLGQISSVIGLYPELERCTEKDVAQGSPMSLPNIPNRSDFVVV